jgi:hypothetical protein
MKEATENKVKCRARILRLGITCLMSATSLLAQREVFAPPNDVSLTVSTERRTYRTGEEITLKYRVTNISNAPLYVPREWEAKCPTTPHVWAWFENSSGQHFVPGYGGSCSPSSNSPTIRGRMSREAVLLKAGGHLDGTFQMKTTLFDGLKPGAYRIEAVLSGSAEEKFTVAERSELARMPHPFLRGEVPSTVRITLAPNAE